jgi:hypothetical protein
LPQFAYQLHLASGEVEKSVNDEKSIRQFLKGMYGGKGPDGEIVFEPEKGVLLENLEKVGDNRLLNGEVSDDLSLFVRGERRSFIQSVWKKAISHVGTRVSMLDDVPARDRETAAQRECCHIQCHLNKRRERNQKVGFARHQHDPVYGSYRDRPHCVVSERASDTEQAMVC